MGRWLGGWMVGTWEFLMFVVLLYMFKIVYKQIFLKAVEREDVNIDNKFSLTLLIHIYIFGITFYVCTHFYIYCAYTIFLPFSATPLGLHIF